MNVRSAAAKELSGLEQRLATRVATPERWIDHDPEPKQRRFLSLTCLEALYGGAVGGGKTDALLMAAAQYVHVPGYAALLLRRKYTDLAKDGAIMDRAKAWWIPKGVHWAAQDKRFTFPSGATISFGHLDTERDKYDYQGGEWQFVGFDELTQFPERWYVYLFSRLRRLRGSNVPIRMRAASNPGDIGHDWVHRRFVNAETRRSEVAFVPATLEDNPHLDIAAYDASLDRLDPTLRKQLREGRWVRDTSTLVYAQFEASRNACVETPELTYYLIGLDFGIVDDNAVCVLGWRDHDPCVYVVEAYRIHADVTAMCQEVQRLSTRYHPVQIVGDTGGMGKGFVEELGNRYGIPVDAAEKHNKLGYISLLNADLAKGRIQVCGDKCMQLVEEWGSLAWDESRTKESEGQNNHASDATLYAWRAASAYGEQPEKPAPVYGTPEFWAAQQAATIEKMERQLKERLGYDQ